MKRTRILSSARVAVPVAGVVLAACLVTADTEVPAGLAHADEIVASVADLKLRLLLEEVLQRNPYDTSINDIGIYPLRAQLVGRKSQQLRRH